MRIRISNKIALSAVALVFAFSFGIATQANAASYEKYAQVATGDCLGANSSGTVYKLFSTCRSSDSSPTYGNWIVVSNGSYRLFKNSKTGQCLDSNSSRHVYTNTCSTGNRYQNWSVIHNSSWPNRLMFKNRATGYCLDGSRSTSSVYTNPCSTGNSYQWWE